MHEVIDIMIEARASNAKKVRNLRNSVKLLRSSNVSQRVIRDFVATYRDSYLIPVLPMRARAFRGEAARLRKFAKSELPGIHGSGSYVGGDGYSYCGLADADFYAREEAAEWAEKYEEAAKELPE